MSRISGSPPQVRGKRGLTIGGKDYIGITPAGAGKTEVKNERIENQQDHPRRCGENATFAGVNVEFHGITPAGAGKTLKRSFRNQPFCSRAVQISFNFSNSLNVSLQSGSAR